MSKMKTLYTKNSFEKNTLLMAISKLAIQFAGLIAIPLYTFFVDPSDYGFVDLSITYIGVIIPVLTLRFDMAVFRFLIDARGDKRKSEEIISSALRTILPLLSLIIIIALFANSLLNIPFGWLIIINSTTAIIASIASQIIRGLGNNRDYAISSVFAALVMITAAVFCVAILNLGAAGILLANIAANLVTLVYSIVRVKLHRYIRARFVERQTQKQLLAYSLPLIPEGILWWVMDASDRTVISALLGFTSNGVYAISNRIGSVLNGVTGVLGMSWIQSASEEIDSPNASKFFSQIGNNYYLRLCGSISIFLLPIVSIFFNIIIGQDYAEAYVYVPGIILAAFGSGLLNYTSAIYNAKKLTKKLAITTTIPAVINLALHLVLINSIGIWAAVLSTVISYFVMFVWRYYDIKKVININLDYKTIFKLVALFTIVCVLYYTNNFFLNFANLFIAGIFALLMNRETIKAFILFAQKKLRRKAHK